MLFFSYMFPSFIFLVSFIERISSDGIECPCQQKCGQVTGQLTDHGTKKERAARHYADFVAVDMLQLLGPCNFTTDHITNIIKVTNNTFPKIKNISNLVSAHPMCKLKTKQVTQADNTTHTVCDIAGSRTKFRLGGINGIQDMVLETKNYSLSDQTPYHVYNVTPEGSNDLKFQMAWFENIGSLWFKYDLVRKLQLRGTVIYTGDDLTYTSTGEDSGGFDGKMWSWIHHYLFSTSDGSEVSKEKNLAGMMAGIGIGLFVLGCVLGLILACIALRKTKKPLRVPFSSDPVVEDYYDEDNRL
ncbi:hypothetical protein MAR_009885 [Mya arenaria]|uniref:Uncharacterized protein n=1 Tax=Mya arenaria TaxID=6604 RepID=A0ABY7E3D7_MYAAR|nr:hypothetical protein MAR_009885 [Mya arenaria]